MLLMLAAFVRQQSVRARRAECSRERGGDYRASNGAATAVVSSADLTQCLTQALCYITLIRFRKDEPAALI
eukprot:SAG11_NODE_9898_length_871_cov_1.593264_1_plen_71_part_00